MSMVPIEFLKKDKKGRLDTTKFSKASPCGSFDVFEPLAYPSMKTDKGRFDSIRFSQAIFLSFRSHDMFGGPLVIFK